MIILRFDMEVIAFLMHRNVLSPKMFASVLPYTAHISQHIAVKVTITFCGNKELHNILAI